MKFSALLVAFAATLTVAQAGGCNDLVIDGGKEFMNGYCKVYNHCSYSARILCPMSQQLLDQCGGTVNADFKVGCFEFTINDNGGGGGHDGGNGGDRD